MSTATKQFTLAAVLSVTTGRLLAEDKMADVYRILDWIMDDNLTTIGLLVVAPKARAFLYDTFPELRPLGVQASMDSLDRWIQSDKTPDKTEFYKMWKAELKMMHPEIKDVYDVPQLRTAAAAAS